MNRVLVTGATGQLGSGLLASARRSAARAVRGASLEVTGVGRADMDVADRASVIEVMESIRPDIVIHAGALTDVDGCERDPERAFAVNAFGTRNVVEASRRIGAHVCYISTDYVFDGELDGRGYHEWDRPDPLCVYGASKLAGERELSLESTVIRTSWLAGAVGRNFVRTVLQMASGERELRFVDDQAGCPTFTEDLAPVVMSLARERRPGVFHVTNQGFTSWYGLARATLEEASLDPERVVPIATSELDPPRPARRPAWSVLDNMALRLGGVAPLPHWRDGLRRLIASLRDTMGG